MSAIDPQLAAWIQAHPLAQGTFDGLAAREGQNLQAALVPPAAGFDGLVIRYVGAAEPSWAIDGDGILTDLR